VFEKGREEGEHDRLVAEAVRQVERFDLVGHERGGEGRGVVADIGHTDRLRRRSIMVSPSAAGSAGGPGANLLEHGIAVIDGVGSARTTSVVRSSRQKDYSYQRATVV